MRSRALSLNLMCDEKAFNIILIFSPRILFTTLIVRNFRESNIHAHHGFCCILELRMFRLKQIRRRPRTSVIYIDIKICRHNSSSSNGMWFFVLNLACVHILAFVDPVRNLNFFLFLSREPFIHWDIRMFSFCSQ